MTTTMVSDTAPAARRTSAEVALSALARDWKLLACFGVFAAIPVAFGALRLSMMAAPDLAKDSYYAVHAVPLTLHIVGATLFAFVGALQLAPTLRRRFRGLHRRLGWTLVPAGIVGAASGVYLRVLYEEPGTVGFQIGLVQSPFALIWIVALVLGVRAIRSGDVARHEEWMLRSYALGLSASTQFLFFAPFIFAGTMPTGTASALYLAIGWLLNLAVVERVIRRRQRERNAAAVADDARRAGVR